MPLPNTDPFITFSNEFSCFRGNLRDITENNGPEGEMERKRKRQVGRKFLGVTRDFFPSFEWLWRKSGCEKLQIQAEPLNLAGIFRVMLGDVPK
jgi:hypothetical protein